MISKDGCKFLMKISTHEKCVTSLSLSVILHSLQMCTFCVGVMDNN